MKTSKPISCITYNTNEFLDLRLSALITQHVIEFYAYINHKGEEEVDLSTGETKRDKDHTHLFIKPNKSIDTMELMTLLIEVTPNNDKPLKPLCFQNSKWDDWYLYAIHDENYLATKFEVKQYHYTNEEIHSSDIDELTLMCYNTFHESKYVQERNFMNYIQSGGDIATLVRKGVIKPSQCFSYINFEKLYYGGNRNE